MKISKIILTSAFGMGILVLSAQPGLAQPNNKNEAPAKHYENSSSQPGGERKAPPRTNNSPNKPGDKKQQYGHNDKSPDKNPGQYNGPNQARSQKPGPGLDKNRPGSHQGLNHHQARELAQANKMTGYKPLPPNAKRHMAPGKPLPRDVQARPVPEHMRAGLPQHPGYEWRIAGTDLLLVAAGTLIISQIIENVFN